MAFYLGTSTSRQYPNSDYGIFVERNASPSHACGAICVKFGCDRSVIRETTTCRTPFLFGCISDSLRRIFMKLHTLHSPRMRLKRHKFACNRLQLKPIYLGIKLRSRLHLDYLWGNFLGTSDLALPTHAIKRRKVGCHRSEIKATLLGEQSTFSFISQLQFM